ncbi:chitin synthase-domain-containing protein, partial [Boletus edulis BED1]
ELEIYHQMRDVIGIDPAFYGYVFTLDADTARTLSLNRLVALAAGGSSVIGICGETKLSNEEGSWWTMIQVYRYYISWYHLSKAFESPFGSVSCLPGCFSLYQACTADGGRPIIVSNRIVDEYAECNVDTLRKKNLAFARRRPFPYHAPQASPDVQDEIHSGHGDAYDGARIMAGPVFSTTLVD